MTAQLFTALVLAASQDASGITGSWELQHPTSPLRLVLAAEGSGTLNGVAVRWSFENGLLSLAATPTGRVQRFQARLAEKTLTLSGAGMPEEVVLTRVQAEGPDKRLLGRWENPSGARFEFRDDGTVVNARGTFPYSSGGSLLFVTINATVFSSRYAIENDKLVLLDGDRKVEFTRSTGDKTVAAGPRPAAARNIVVNGVKLSDEVLSQLEAAYRVRVLDGAYWYDRRCGAWGLDGGPTAGIIVAGLDLGGPLASDASRGRTGVFVNGRELPIQDVLALQQLTPVYRGRYWIDAMGNVGYENNPTVMLNLVQLSNRARGGNTYHSRNGLTGIGSGGNGKTSYVMGKDWSVIIGE